MAIAAAACVAFALILMMGLKGWHAGGGIGAQAVSSR